MKEQENLSFFAGSEEIIARFAALVISLAGFAIYFVSRGDVNFVWYELTWILTIFWFVYELIAFILFSLFRFFSKRESNSTPEPIAEIADNNEN